jgi:hypothetical protein
MSTIYVIPAFLCLALAVVCDGLRWVGARGYELFEGWAIECLKRV